MSRFCRNKKKFVTIAGLSLILTACSTISRFDQYAYTQTTSLKVDALSLMGHATESYSLHKGDVMELQTSIDKMFEYERNRPKNRISEKMWSVLTDSTGNLYGGFIKRWAKEDKLDTAFIRITKDIVGQSFDQISQLESGKIKPPQAN